MSRKIAPLWVIFVILLGFFLRLYRLEEVPLRGDEAFSAMNWAALPLRESLQTIATIEPFPPLTYGLFRSWGVAVGIENEFALRMLSVLLNIPGIAAVCAIGYRLNGRNLGILAAFLWALHPFHIWHAQDFRTYGMWVSLSAIAFWLGLRLADGKRRAVDWILYIAVATVTVFIFYNELLMMAALSLFILLAHRHDRPFVIRWTIMQVIIFSSALLTFWIFQGEIISNGTYGGTATRFNPSELATQFIPVLIFGETIPEELLLRLWLPLCLLLITALFFIWRNNRQRAILLAALGILPLAFLSLAATKLSIFRPRYTLPVTTTYVLILGYGLIIISQQVKAGKLRGIMISASIGIWLIITSASLQQYFHTSHFIKSPDWIALSDYLQQRVDENDVIIQRTADAAFGYYYKGTAFDISIPYNPAQSRDDAQKILDELLDQYNSFWIVAQKPEWPNADILDEWAANNLQLVRETSVSNLPVQQYKHWNVDEDEIKERLPVTYDDRIQLVGATIFETPEPAGQITLWLYWRPLAHTTEPLKVFAHLIGDLNPETGSFLWSQDDRFPQNGRVTTDDWEIGQLYRDVYSIPITRVPPGNYIIRIGFYNPRTGAKLPANIGDSGYDLREITLQ